MKKPMKILALILGIIALIALLIYLEMLAWNHLAITLFHLPTITYLQAVCISFILSLSLSGRFRSSKS